MDGHYDRAADIAWLRLEGWDERRVKVEKTASGLVERDRESGRILGLEYWEASKRLPAELLDALPAPPSRDVVMETQRA
jgi:uncharacterized protein YuzE